MYSWIYFAARNVINGPGQSEESVTNSALPNMFSVLHWASTFLSLEPERATQTAAIVPKPDYPAAEHGETSGLDNHKL